MGQLGDQVDQANNGAPTDPEASDASSTINSLLLIILVVIAQLL